MNWYLKVLNQYADFDGRARRTEYWMFALFNMIFTIVAVILDNVFGIAMNGVGYGPIYGLYALFVFLPGLGVSVRRLHDIGKSGWMILIALIPLIGSIWLLILFATDGDPKENEYGQNPKGNSNDSRISTGLGTEADLDSDSNLDSGLYGYKETSSLGDTIILIVVVWMVINKCFWAILPLFFDNFFATPSFRVLSIFLNLVWAVIPLLLAFTVRKKSVKTILFVIGGIYLAYAFIEIVIDLIKL